MKLWERLDKAIAEKEHCENKLKTKITLLNGEEIFINIESDPRITITKRVFDKRGYRDAIFENKTILEFDVFEWKKFKEAVDKLLDKE